MFCFDASGMDLRTGHRYCYAGSLFRKKRLLDNLHVLGTTVGRLSRLDDYVPR